jgi:ribose 5-phosphate isomerase B
MSQWRPACRARLSGSDPRGVRVAIAADHAGLPLRPTVADAVRAAGHEPLLCGPDTAPPEGIDYPLVARAVADALETTDADRGVLVCGSGAGVSIAANKLVGVRAALCHDLFTARQSREDDDANVICLGSGVVTMEQALALVRTFIAARFSHAERHERRLAKVRELEASECCRGDA